MDQVNARAKKTHAKDGFIYHCFEMHILVCQVKSILKGDAK